MGNKLANVKPASHIMSLYKRITISDIAMILKAFKNKFSFQAMMLSREEFSSISTCCYFPIIFYILPFMIVY